MENPTYWRKCSVCKKEIKFDKAYQSCTVSTCRKSVYCCVECFDTHVPLMNHKSAWAEENHAPSLASFLRETTGAGVGTSGEGRRVIIETASTSSSHSQLNQVDDHEVLIVASKLKNYVKMRSEFNTSSSVMDRLSDIVRILCDRALENARSEGRKTLMDRDFDFFKF